MDQNETPPNQPDGQNLYKPDKVVTSDQVSTTTPDSAPTFQPVPNEEPNAAPKSNSVTWTASEFIVHYKAAGWYLLLTIGALIVGTLVWFLTKDKISTALVLVGVLMLGIYASHKPREITYALDSNGLTIGNRHYPFYEFRSFSVVSEGAFSSIELTPLKRFAMYMTIYFDPADEDKIIGVMSDHMPMEEPRNDLIDQLMHRLRF